MKTSDTKANKFEFTLGLLSICVWLMYLGYVPPFTNYPVSTIPSIQNTINFSTGSAYMMIAVGVLGGFLLLKAKELGKHITIAISIYMIVGRIIAAFSHGDGLRVLIVTIYKDLFFISPIPTIHKNIISPIVFILSIVYLFGHYSKLVKRKAI